MAVVIIVLFCFFFEVHHAFTIKKKGKLWFPEDVFNIQAAVGWVSDSQARIVRTGLSSSTNPQSLAGLLGIRKRGKSAGRLEHSQHV